MNAAKPRSSVRLGIRLVAIAGVLVAAALGAPAGASAAECPNQSVREQQAYTYLPDCRGLELASPVLKNGEEVETKGILSTFIPFAAAAAGPAVSYPASGGLPGTESAGLYTQYVASAGSLGSPWQNLSLNPAATLALIEGVGPRITGEYEYFAPDMSCGLVTSRLPIELPAGELASEFIKNVYRWTASDNSFHLLTNERPPVIDTSLAQQESPETLEVAGASTDCTKVVFESTNEYAEGPDPSTVSTKTPRALYEADGSKVEVASVLPNGTPTGVIPIGRGEKGPSIGIISNDGSRVYFSSFVEAGAQDAGFQGVFLREGGTTVEISKPQGGPAAQDTGAKFQAASSDGSRVFFIANAGLTPTGSSTATPCQILNGTGCDLYEYNADTKALTDLSPDTTGADTNGASVPGVVGISPDGTNVYFTSLGQLVPGQGNTQAKNETQTAKASGSIGAFVNFDVVRAIAVKEGPEGNAIVVKTLGGVSQTLSVSTTGTTITVQLATDASSAVTSTAAEVIAAINAEPAAAKLVHADNGVAGGTTGGGIVSIGEFQLKGGSAPNPRAEVTGGEVNLYRYHAGALSYVTSIGAAEAGHVPSSNKTEFEVDTVASDTHGQKYLTARVSSSGDYLLFATRSKVKEFDGTEYNNEDRNAAGTFDWMQYEYSTATGKVTCVSCNPDRSVKPVEFEAAAKGAFTAFAPFKEVRTGYVQRFLSDDGRVFFDSYAPLAAQATNGTVNAYQWEPEGVGSCAAGTAAGCISILDSGTDTFPTYVEGASIDGAHAYITTHEALTPQDIDGLRDVYDVRIDGGLIPPAGPIACTGEECQGAPGGGLGGVPHGSELPGGGNLPAGTVVITPSGGTVGGVKGFTKRMVKGSSVTVTVVAPSAGRVSAAGKGLKTAKMSVSKSGTYKLKVALTAKEKKLLAGKRKHKKGVALTVRISFVPTSGKASSATAKVTFK